MNWIDRRRQQQRRRRTLKLLVASLGMLGAFFVAGALLPAEHRFTSKATLERPPETVWRVLVDVDGMPLWRSDLTAVERLPDLEGRPAWREYGKSGDQIVGLTLAEPPRRLVLQRASLGRPALPMRTFELAATAGGTLVTVTDRVEAKNPLQRVLVRLHVPRPAVERLLRDLSERFSTDRREVVVQRRQ
jgi:uncharacterized protein YndB with AHSA1/START domain